MTPTETLRELRAHDKTEIARLEGLLQEAIRMADAAINLLKGENS